MFEKASSFFLYNSINGITKTPRIKIAIKGTVLTFKIGFAVKAINAITLLKIPKKMLGEILDLLLESQYVISMGFSSTILEAQVLDKPVISLSVDHDVYETPKNVLDSCLVSDIENFEENFVQLIKNSEFCEKIIKNSNKQLESDFTNIGNSAENILREINKND